MGLAEMLKKEKVPLGEFALVAKAARLSTSLTRLVLTEVYGVDPHVARCVAVLGKPANVGWLAGCEGWLPL